MKKEELEAIRKRNADRRAEYFGYYKPGEVPTPVERAPLSELHSAVTDNDALLAEVERLRVFEEAMTLADDAYSQTLNEVPGFTTGGTKV